MISHLVPTLSLVLFIAGIALMPMELQAELESESQRERRFELTEKGLQGDIPSIMQLGNKYLLEGDKELAIKWFRDAADLSHESALWKLVGIYEHLPLIERSQIVKGLYEELIVLGQPEGHYRLGRLYQWSGHPLYQPDFGDIYLKDAAKLGVTEAKLLLGKLYMGDWNHKQDTLQAVDYLTQASSKSGEACRHLGMIYRYGVGVKTNLELAWRYYGQGARLSDTDSMFAIAEALFLGEDIVQDKPRAHRYYFDAAKLGHREASRQLKSLDFGDDKDELLYP